VEGSTNDRILIVEDDETVRGFLMRALEGQDCHPVGAQSGEEAIETVTTPPGVAAALIDGILPDMHGFRLAQRIVDDPAGHFVGICFVTGAVRDVTRFSAGIGALAKPVRLAELRGAVSELLRWRESGGNAIEDRRAALAALEQVFLVGP